MIVGLTACTGSDDGGSSSPATVATSTTVADAAEASSAPATTSEDAPAPTTEAATTTTLPPDPTLSFEAGAIVVDVREGQVIAHRADGRVEAAPDGGDVCTSPKHALTSDALVVACDDVSVVVGLDEADVRTVDADQLGPAVPPAVGAIPAGDRWFVFCAPPAAGTGVRNGCVVVSTDGGNVIDVEVPMASGLSAHGDLLHVISTDGTFAVIDVPAGMTVYEATLESGRTRGVLVGLPDGTTALQAGFSTEGDERPERFDLRDPRRDESLGIEDGADLLPLTGVGPTPLRPVDGVVVQAVSVVAQDPAGTELWSAEDREVVAVSAPGRLWLYRPGDATIVEVDPLTGTELGTIDLPGPIEDEPGAVDVSNGRLAARYDPGTGTGIAVVNV